MVIFFLIFQLLICLKKFVSYFVIAALLLFILNLNSYIEPHTHRDFTFLFLSLFLSVVIIIIVSG